jgi:serine/threonine protein kinase/TPR repeat protein
MSHKTLRHALRPGHRILWYEISEVLGQGGFGITYRARDTNLNHDVAIKEYLPSDLALREADSSVCPLSDERGEEFNWGLKRFITEAQTLAQFDHPNIVRVHSVFEANNTAYMVMRYEQGEDFAVVLSRRRTLAEAELLDVIFPILDGLEQVHSAGFVHRDIKPSNILIRQDRSPILIDFGSARQALGAQTKTLTSIVSPGYAPFEQYYSKSDEQGPWTDIYGLGATMYRAITGGAPMDAVERSRGLLHGDDEFVSGSEAGKGHYSAALLQAVDHALAFKPQDRPQTLTDWRRELKEASLAVAETPPDEATTIVSEEPPPVVTTGKDTKPGTSPPTGRAAPAKSSRYGVLVGIVAIAVAGMIGFLFWAGHDTKKDGVTKIANDDAQRTPAVAVGSPTPAKPAARQADIDQQAAVEVEEPAEPPSAGESTGPEAPSSPAVSTVATAPEAPASPRALPAPTASTAPTESIAELLAAAEADIAALRLTNPSGNNAFERYQVVLTRDPDNPQAQQGLERIAQRYVELAEQAAIRGDIEKAAGYLRKVDELAADNDAMKDALDTLMDQREETGFAALDDGADEDQFGMPESIDAPGYPYAQQPSMMAGLNQYAAIDPSASVSLLQSAAAEGDPVSQYNLGQMFYFGTGVPQDYTEAARWYRKAAEQGNPGAQSALGMMYLEGRGVPRDEEVALDWLVQAAAQGDQQAQFWLDSLGQ